ncbi:MAG: amidophosphoribosyltransferase [Promethearchaeota archaeon]
MIFNNHKVREFCGVFGISCTDYSYSVAGLIYSGLMALQHRGQLFSGISIKTNENNIITYKDKGLVSKVLNPKKLKSMIGNVGIGHVCYGKPFCTNIETAQPYHSKINNMEFSIAINGIISNYSELHNELSKMGRVFTGNSDIELISVLIETLINLFGDRISALKKLFELLKGAYSIIVLFNDGNIYAMRDPKGYKPLCYGKLSIENKLFFIISSESCAIDVIGGNLIKDVSPGEIINIHPTNKIEKYQILNEKVYGVCEFEYIYFARPDSIIDGIPVGDVRYKLGQFLAETDNFFSEDAIVVPIPDSGRSAAMGYSWKSKIPYEEGLMKNRYMWQLKSNVEEKLNPIKEIVKDKDIILVDDSIISGNTIKKIISMLRNAKAKSIHVRISCPPIIKNCEFNDSISNRELLIAFQAKVRNYDNFNEEMRKFIGADSLKFQSIEGLFNAIGNEENAGCIDCFKEFCLVDEESKISKMDIIHN